MFRMYVCAHPNTHYCEDNNGPQKGCGGRIWIIRSRSTRGDGFREVQLRRTAYIPSVDRVVEEFPSRQRPGHLAGKVHAPVVV